MLENAHPSARMFEAFEKNTAIKTLYVYNCELTNADDLAAVLMRNKKITEVFLSANKITNADAFLPCSHLSLLSFVGNPLEPESAERLKAALPNTQVRLYTEFMI
jgi:hypothetical protein